MGVRRERLLFALVLLIEWHHVFNKRRRSVARRYSVAMAGPNRGRREFI